MATEALGRLGDARASEPLIVALKDADRAVRQGAAKALGRLRSTEIQPLIAILTERDKWRDAEWRDAVQALGYIWQLPDLVRLGNIDPKVRRRAAEALGTLGDVRAVEPLIAALQDGDKVVRRRAAEALGRLGDARAIEPLIATLQRKDSITRRQAHWALRRIGTPKALAALREYEEQRQRQGWI
jgi:HEAT repeat protein